MGIRHASVAKAAKDIDRLHFFIHYKGPVYNEEFSKRTGNFAGVLVLISGIGISASLQSGAWSAPGCLDGFIHKHKIKILVACIDQLLPADACIDGQDR